MSSPASSVSIVDDDAEVRAALARLVASAGFDASVHAGGDELLQAVAQRRPDCIVLDLQMPGTSGFDVLQALARQQVDVPVVAITGYDSAAARTAALGLGARAYLCKPVDDEALLAAIADAIEPGSIGGRPNARG
ncbi:MAG: response regulator [Burkholderiales bacterium]|nr:response regulator [Burkholderiales bacterium]